MTLGLSESRKLLHESDPVVHCEGSGCLCQGLVRLSGWYWMGESAPLESQTGIITLGEIQWESQPDLSAHHCQTHHQSMSHIHVSNTS